MEYIDIRLKVKMPYSNGTDKLPGDIITIKKDDAERWVKDGAAEYIIKNDEIEEDAPIISSDPKKPFGLPEKCPEFEVPCPQRLEEQDDKTCGKCFIQKKGSHYTAITYRADGIEVKNIDKKPPEGTITFGEGYSIRPAERGGGMVIYKGEDALQEIKRSSNTYLDTTAQCLGVDRKSLDDAILKFKTTPKPEKKKENGAKPNTQLPYEIIDESMIRITPHAGIIDGRRYFGFYLPCKIVDPETQTTAIKMKFHILFSDGELIPGDEATLNQLKLYPTSKPTYFVPRVPPTFATGFNKLPSVGFTTIYNRLIEELKIYLELSNKKLYTLLAAWIIGTYLHRRFYTFPYLNVGGMKRAGKSKLLTFLSLTTYNALFSSSITGSALFRSIQNAGCTILADETEKLDDPERAQDVRSIYLEGYKLGAVAYRSEHDENDNFVPTPFEVYSPKATASIKGLDDVMEDRSIPVIIKRGLNKNKINRAIPIQDPKWEKIRAMLMQLALETGPGLEAAYQFFEPDFNEQKTEDVSEGAVCAVNAVSAVNLDPLKIKIYIALIVGRDFELWSPLLSMIYYFEEGPPNITAQTTQTALTAQDKDIDKNNLTALTAKHPIFKELADLALEIIAQKNENESSDTSESKIIRALLDLVHNDDWYTVKSILQKTVEHNDSEQPEWMNNRWLGRALTRMGFGEKKHIGKGMLYHLTPDVVEDMATRIGVVFQKRFDNPPDPEEEIHQPEEPPDISNDGKTDISKPNLAENQSRIIEIVGQHEVSTDYIISKLGVKEDEGLKLIKTAERDRLIFSPRPNLWKRS